MTLSPNQPVMPNRRGFCVGIAILLVGACGRAPERPGAQSRPDRIVNRWLTCEECNAGELDSVRATGDTGFRRLIIALRGPPDSVLTTLRRSSGDAFARARRAFDRLSAAERAQRPLGDSALLVSRNVRNFAATYSGRAARAAFAIDRPRARTEFLTVLRADTTGALRPLEPVLRRLLDSLAHTSP